MAVISDNNRILCWETWMRRNLNTVSIDRNDLRAAINAADDWVDSNATSFNNALPVAARSNLTAEQKSLLLMLVVERRYLG